MSFNSAMSYIEEPFQIAIYAPKNYRLRFSTSLLHNRVLLAIDLKNRQNIRFQELYQMHI